MMDLFHKLDVTDLDMLKMQLGKLQMVGRLGYKKESEEFVDIMKGFRIIQNMAEYIMEKIVTLEKMLPHDDLETGYTEITPERCVDVKNEDETDNSEIIVEVVVSHVEVDVSENVEVDVSEHVERDESEHVSNVEQMSTKYIGKSDAGLSRAENSLRDLGGKSIFRFGFFLQGYVNLKRFNTHKCGNNKKKVQCDICDKQILKKCIAKHKQIHAESRVYECLPCGKTFKSKTIFENHEQRGHNECDVCYKCFTKPFGLRKHKLNIHSGVKRERVSTPRCKFCELECTSFGNLKKHMKYAHLDKAIYCHTCENPFFTKKGLEKHQAEHITVAELVNN